MLVEDVTPRFACLGLWGPRAREILEPLTTADLSNEAFPVPAVARARGRARAVPGASRHLRWRARLGALLPHRVRPPASGTRSGRRAGSTRSSQAATRRSTRSGSRRATASGAPTSHRTTRRGRRGSASRSSSTRTSSARRRSRQRGSPERRLAASSSTTRERWRSAPSRSIGGEPVGRVTSGGYGYTVERSIAYAYVPAQHAEPGTAVEIEIFGEAVPGLVAEEPLYDPKGERLRS